MVHETRNKNIFELISQAVKEIGYKTVSAYALLALLVLAIASGPQIFDGPNAEIEWNSLGDRQPHTLIVEAVDTLGPVPPENLYDSTNTPLVSPLQNGAMLGSNKGATPDGKVSTNGQGPST